MMRYIVALLLIFHFGLGLVSCTTGDAEDDTFAEENEPISDADVAGDSDDGGGDEGSGDEGGGEVAAEDDELESDDLEPSDDEGGEQASTGEADEEGDDAELESDLESEPDNQQQPQVAQEEPPPPVDDLQPAEPTPEPTEPPPPPPPVVEEKAKVRDIRFVANSAGGTVVIETTKPVTYQSRLNPATQQFVIEIADAELPAALQRPYPTKGAGSRIGSINAYQGEGNSTARIVIQLSGAPAGEPIVQQEGTSLVVVPPTPAPVVRAEPPPSDVGSPVDTPPGEVRAAKEALGARTLDEFLTGNQKFYGRLISLQVKDADVRDVVNFLAEESGANVVMSDDVDGKISLKLRRVPWDQALVTLMRTKGLGYVRQGNVLRISTLKSLQAETEAASKIIEAQKAIVPAVVEVIPVSYAAIDELKTNLGSFLSKDGKVVADNRTSTIIVTDKQEVVDRVRKLIKTLDIPPAQVSIESKIVEAVENFQNFIGINWSFGGSPLNMSPAGGANGAPIDLTMNMSSATISRNFAGASPFNANVNVGVLDFFGDISAALTLAETESLAKVISAPRISAMNREKSTITQEGENVAIKSTVATVGAGSATTAAIAKEEKRTPFKLELSVTPQITADGGVIMDLDVKREFLGPEIDAETKSRAVNKRSAKTKVLVKNGQTAVIGGIYTSDELEFTNGVPGLRNIPLIGWLFKNRSYERSKNELLIFLTPRILAQDDLTQDANQAIQ